ncbi:hypothetical protein ASPBRDRAFT_201559 [Aspergillus brasiliensis CBS 101740]|uniref:Extracellular membrane protein CFEM domain-containing protein n=1 Tax=Aspergillus brasiliensis (strain CBS 101740 / IMI 381727 / IBT 21946) TaxID=767769 RepID=A0A1L9U2B7_ASPBC|nr:hypothetical protein ASPBRDRAFT_201559 [Aspergillus brasiliensis CBS 101740]
MRFSVIIVTLIGAACAAKLPSGAPCKQDGSMGVCESNLCVQTPSQAQGVCK